VGPSHYGLERRESAQEKAERILGEEMKRRGWTEEQLRLRAKGDVEKVLMAQRLRQETTVTLKWIAHRLEMGTWTNVANCLGQNRHRLSG
jgi:hypothetical protein